MGKLQKFLIVVMLSCSIVLVVICGTVKQLQDMLQQSKFNQVTSHYYSYVKSNNVIPLYQKNGNQYIEMGKIEKDQLIELKDIKINYLTNFFPLKNNDSYYVKYNDVLPVIESDNNNRYQNYIPFNENIITKVKFNLYNEDGKVIFVFNKSLSFPIIIKGNNRYYVEYDNKLLYIKKEDVKEIIPSNNTTLKQTMGVRVLAYHFFYKKESKECQQNICLETSVFEQQLKYLKDNEFFFVTMKELEAYIDGKIQLPPKSIVLTIDDGWLAHDGIELLEKYQINATLFLMTGPFDKEEFESKYLEIHSHGHNLHTPGVCPGGQGGGIKCLPHDQLLNDLQTSRHELNNTTVFCYPFYEYNDYSISVLKEAGFTMAFTGIRKDMLVHVGSDKFKLPRYTIRSYLTFDGFKKLVG